MARRWLGARPVWRGAALLALSLLAAAACAQTQRAARVGEGASQPPSMAAETTASMAADTTASVATETPPAAAVKPESPQQILEPPAEPPAPQKTARLRVNDDPHQLMGLAPEALGRLLGPPSLLRTETPAEVWQYRAADCVLDIFLYAEEEKPDRSRVTYYEIRAADSAPSGARACFADIIERRNLAAVPES